MRLPLSKSQIERLGTRLIATPEPDSRDLESLHELLRVYAEVLSETVVTVRNETGLAPTARVKNTGTILEKLHRYGGSWLKSIQDLAGMRIVGDFDRNGQNSVVAELVELFNTAPRSPKIVDRRVEPVQGYRAVHVVAFPDGLPVEVQVRTRLQHEWAEIFEKLADLVGRDIRYGEPPSHWLTEAERSGLSFAERRLYETSYGLREITVALALVTADMLDAVEEGEQVEPDASELPGYRQGVVEAIADLRTAVSRLESA